MERCRDGAPSGPNIIKSTYKGDRRGRVRRLQKQVSEMMERQTTAALLALKEGGLRIKHRQPPKARKVSKATLSPRIPRHAVPCRI